MRNLDGKGVTRRLSGMACAFTLVLTALSSIPVLLLPARVSALTSHAPILIEGDAGFTAANGVTRGTGTLADPFVIEGWRISAATANGIEVRNTSAHLVIQDLEVFDGRAQGFFFGVMLEAVSNASIINLTATGNIFGVELLSVSHTAIIDSVFADNNRAIDGDGGYNLTIEGNSVSSDFIGLGFHGFDDLRLNGNQLLQYSFEAAYVQDSSNVTVESNIVSGSDGWYELDRVWSANVSGNLGPSITLVFADSSNITATANDVVGMTLDGSRDIALVGNDVFSIDVYDSNDTIIDSNSGVASITVTSSGSIRIVNHTFSPSGTGVTLQESENITVEENVFRGLGLYIQGLQSSHFDSHVIPSGNTVNAFPLIYRSNCAGTVIEGVTAGEIIIANCSGIRVANETIQGTGTAIELAFVTNASIDQNHLVQNLGEALPIFFSENVTISGNNISYNFAGAGISYSHNVTVLGNDFVGQTGGGGWAGYALAFEVVQGAKVHHNRFIDNVEEAGNFGPSVVEWDDGYPSGGNWWSGYRMYDVCSGPNQDVCPDPDGFGDFPYQPDYGVIDHYPRGPVNLPPLVAFNWTPLAPIAWWDTVYFNAYDAYDPDGQIVDYEWDLGDGSICSGAYECQNTYADPGSFTVTLVVTDNSGASVSLSKTLRVYAKADIPIALFTVNPWQPVAGETVELNALSSWDPNGLNLTYRWTFSSSSELTGPVIHVAMQLHSLHVTLTVTNAVGLEGSLSVDILTSIAPGELVPYEHRSGFRIPIPSNWVKTEDVDAGDGQIFELVLEYSTLGEDSTILIDTGYDNTVRENEAYLSQIVDIALDESRNNSPSASIIQTPFYGNLAGHYAVTFEIRYRDVLSAQIFYTVFVVVVSEELDRFWILGLTVPETAYPRFRTMFGLMVEGFTITLSGNSGLLLAILMGGIAGVIGVAAAIILIRTRKRKRSSASTPGRPPLSSPTLKCANCGGAMLSNASYCTWCGWKSPPTQPMPEQFASRNEQVWDRPRP